MIHQELALKIAEVEDGLSQLPSRHASLSNHVPVVTRSNLIHDQGRPLDLLEVYCGPNSQLTQQVIRKGGKAKRFSWNEGDLNTVEGVQKLWLWIYLYEPRHIWMAPECRLWGKFSNLSMSKSHELFEKIVHERIQNKHHLQLCNEIYLYQTSKRRHAHLEQPGESTMVDEPELSDLREGTLKSLFDMCRMGRLRLPKSNKFLRKRTRVQTTSGYLDFHLHEKYCRHDHEHEVIQGSMKHEGRRVNVSSFAAAYTSTFGSFVAEKILQECKIKEPPVVVYCDHPEDVFAVGEKHGISDPAPQNSQCQKRRRHGMKGPLRESDEHIGPVVRPSPRYGRAPTWNEAIKRVTGSLPRVGNLVIKGEDQLCQDFHMLVPELDVKLVLVCRGTERFRVPGSLAAKGSMPWRKTILVSRDDGSIIDLGPPENWCELSRVKQTRRAGSARVSVTVFGEKTAEQPGNSEPSGPKPVSESNVFPPIESMETDSEETKQQLVSLPCSQPERDVKNRHLGSDQMECTRDDEDEAWAPKVIPKSGPSFLSLSPQQKSDLRRLHSNLGHPSTEKLCRLLSEQGADQTVIDAAKDFQCDVCVENRRGPKLPNPSTIHDPRDFNDVVGCDGVYWKGVRGVTYHFLHFIDESTLFQLGAVSGRSVEEQISTFEDVWLQWAGPCKVLYLDPAGEYINDKWHTFLQKENIKVSMSAGDSHWQLGRAESHGKIIKQMLTAMDVESPIESLDEFKRCLRQAFSAKNSLGQVRGFSPEQAVLGKAKALPGSLMSDVQAAAHSILDSETPDGVRFREDMARRERARRAFIHADNSQAMRRALLRRPRVDNSYFQKGDWVLYWRHHKGHLKGDKGRWHGPGQVVVNESHKVIWISHAGYLIRASPQQIRPASMREFKGLQRGQEGKVVSVAPQCRNFVDLQNNAHEGDLPNLAEPTVVESTVPMSTTESQPDGERFPADLISNPYTPTTPVHSEGGGGGEVPGENPEGERESGNHLKSLYQRQTMISSSGTMQRCVLMIMGFGRLVLLMALKSLVKVFPICIVVKTPK